MKSILISVQPKYCELIASGKKTIEVRKTAPKEVPFKAYIYQTKHNWLCRLLRFLNLNDLADRLNAWHGKVFGEFICDEVYDLVQSGLGVAIVDNGNLTYPQDFFDMSCLTVSEIKNYPGIKNGHGLHISDLKIYDKPKELSEFKKPCIMPEMPYCPNCKYGNVIYSSDEVECYKDTEGACSEWNCCNYITRPPQSWMYVEEEVWEKK